MTAGTRIGEQLRARASARGVSGAGAKVAALAIAQGAVYAFPVAFAVICARKLGASNYGVISFYTALTAFLCMFIEFGFDSIGVREVHSGSGIIHPEQVIWNITLAKLIICLPTCIGTMLVLMGGASASASMTAAVVLYMVAFALEPSWYLRALELMRSAMLVAAVSRLAGIGLLVSVVRAPEDLELAMWSYTFVAWANAVIAWLIMRRLGVLGRPQLNVARLRALFKSGAAIVLGNLSGYSTITAGIVVLGAIADPVVTGAANMALRIRAAALALIVPLGQFGFVRLSTLAGIDPRAAVGVGRQVFYVLIACSSLLALVISTHADWIAAMVYGLPEAPSAAGDLVRLLALTLPLNVAAVLFGVQGLTVFRKERAYVWVSFTAAAIFFGLLLVLPAADPATYGWALLASEIVLVLAAGFRLRQTVRHHAKA